MNSDANAACQLRSLFSRKIDVAHGFDIGRCTTAGRRDLVYDQITSKGLGF